MFFFIGPYLHILRFLWFWIVQTKTENDDSERKHVRRRTFIRLPSFCCFCTATAFCVHASHLAFLIGMLYENPEIRGIFPKKGRKKTPHENYVFKIFKQPNKRAAEKRCNANFSVLYFQKETRLRIQMSCPSVP